MAEKKKRGGYPSCLYKSSIYMAWANMKTRCLNNGVPDYLRYGKRGISICKEWGVFSGFYSDMGSSHKDGLTLDRIDNNKDYEKNNCRWVNREKQANNRRSNRILPFGGKKKTVAEWAKETGIKSTTIRQRIDAYGWPVEKALTVGV